MKKEQVLKKVIEKAVKNGWDFLTFIKAKEWEVIESSVGLEVKAIYSCANPQCKHRVYYNAEKIIFSHDFAVNFFGKKWKSRLQEMVVCDEPLKYLKRYL